MPNLPFPLSPELTGQEFESDSDDDLAEPLSFRGVPVPTPKTDDRTMANNQMMNNLIAPVITPIRFDGEKSSSVEDFLDTLEMGHPFLEQQVTEDKRERAKILVLQNHLDGKARHYWTLLAREKKDTFAHAAAALRERFPVTSNTAGAARMRAMTEVNGLTQGDMTSEEYVTKAEELFAVLGNDYSEVLATKFLDGLSDQVLQYTVYAQAAEPLAFSDVIRVFLKCARPVRAREALQQKSVQADPGPNATNSMEFLVQQMGELVRGINHLSMERQHEKQQDFGHQGSYQPIVGVVQQQPAQQSVQQPARQSMQQGANQPQDRNQPYQPPQRQQGYSSYQMRGGNGGYRAGPAGACYTCGDPGHRAYECQAPRNKGNVQSQGNMQNQGNPQGVNHPRQVTCIEIEEEVVAAENDPEGAVMMSTNMVEIMDQEREKKVIERVKQGVYTLEDAAYLAAMGKKRKRNEDADTPPWRRTRADNHHEGAAMRVNPVSSHLPFIPFAAIPKAKKARGEPKPMKLTKVVQCKQHLRAIEEAEIPTEVIGPIEGKVAMEEIEIPAEMVVIQPIKEKVAMEEVEIPAEVVVAIDPEEQAIAEIPAEVIGPIEGKVAMEEMEIPAEVVVAIEPEEQATAEIPVEVIQPNEEAAIKEVVVAIEPEEQAIAEIPAEVIGPIEGKVAMEEMEIPAEMVVIQPIKEKVAMDEVEILVEVIEPEEQAMQEAKYVDVEDRGVVVMEGVTQEEGVIVNSIEAGPEMITMEGVNRVKYKDCKEELVLAEEHSTITEIQVKDIACNIDAWNRCTRDGMMNFTGYDPGGEAWRFKQNYVREEERLRLERNIIRISFGISIEALECWNTLVIADSASHKLFSAPVTNPWSVRLVERNVQLILAGLRAIVGLGISGEMKKQILEDKAIERWDVYLDNTVHVINIRSATKAMWSSLMDWMFGAPKEEPILWAKLPRYAAPQLGDPVLRRRFQADKSLGMKLHAKWDGPYKLTCISKSGVSGDLEDLKTGKVIGRYAFESLKGYVPGSKDTRRMAGLALRRD